MEESKGHICAQLKKSSKWLGGGEGAQASEDLGLPSAIYSTKEVTIHNIYYSYY